MSKRRWMLGLLLAGSIAAASSDMVYADMAGRQGVNPSAGVSGLLTELLAENMSQKKTSEAAGNTEAKGGVAETGDSTAEAASSVHEVPTVKSEYADIAIASVDNYVNLRSEPNTESEVLGKLYNNSAATVLETTDNGWYKIHSGTVEGYVKSEYVVVGNEDLVRAVSTRYAKVGTTTLFVRMEASTEAKVLTMLPEGDDVVVTDESIEGWVRVSTEEGDGYVSLDYVTLFTDFREAESKAEEEARLAREEAERQAAAHAAEEARRAKEAEAAAKQRKNAAKQGSRSAGNQNTGSSKPSSGSVSNGQAVVNYAKQFVGNPYVYGGTSLTNGADCSGFIMSVYAAFGVQLPHSSAALRNVGYAVGLSDIQTGDIVCYSGHAGIYAGNNTLVHASSPETGIKYTSPITYRNILAVRRIF